MPQCEQAYSPRKHTNFLCKLTGQSCLINDINGDHCTRRIFYDQQIARHQGLSGGEGQVVTLDNGQDVRVKLL